MDSLSHVGSAVSFCLGAPSVRSTQVKRVSLCAGKQFVKKLSRLARKRTPGWRWKPTEQADPVRWKQTALVGGLESPRVLHRLLWAPLPASWTGSGEESEGVARGCLDGMRVRRKREPSHQLFWQLRNPSAETRPSPKCELCCVSKAGCSKKWLGGQWFMLG